MINESISDVQKILSKRWVFGFSNLRIADHSQNDDNNTTVFAFDFHAKDDETIALFLSRFNLCLSRMQSSFHLLGASLDFEDQMFAIVEFEQI